VRAAMGLWFSRDAHSRASAVGHVLPRVRRYNRPLVNKRPLSVTIIAALLIAAGAIGFAYHLTEFVSRSRLQSDELWVLAVRGLAIVCGVFLLRGHNWARWLVIAWIAYHVVLSAFHSGKGLIAHILLLAVFVFFLFRRNAREYFSRAK
jgi:hypothetical protein